MENFAVRFADFLEDLAKRARAMTVDRLTKIITYVGIGIGVGAGLLQPANAGDQRLFGVAEAAQTDREFAIMLRGRCW